MTTEAAGRTVEQTIELDAPLDAVWRALTDAEELTRWFPLDARVEPGEGGTIWMSWDEVYQGTATIEVWDPPRHLRTSFPATHMGPLSTDYHLEGERGSTVLRVVTAGFGEGSEWDEYYAGVQAGWAFELRGLKHYLERHRGRERNVATASAALPDAGTDVWEVLTADAGLLPLGDLEGRQPGDGYEVESADGHFEGTLVIWDPPRQFVGTVANWNDALLRFEIEGGRAWVFMSTYGVDAERVADLAEAWRVRLDSLLATA